MAALYALEDAVHSVMSKVTKTGLWQAYAKRYRARMEQDLRKYGLRYEDLLIEDEEVLEALKRLPADVLEARNKRVKRAVDLSVKKMYLPSEIQAMQKPWEPYLQDVLAEVRRENRERVAMSGIERLKQLEKSSAGLKAILSNNELKNARIGH
eukprot:tig00001107_g7106.t1